MATTPVSLEIPAGTYPGQEMSVEWGGVSYSITVPDGTQPGQEITVELPALEVSAAAASSSGTTPVTLIIPDGTHPGQEMAVEWGGVSYSIMVPDGTQPGQEITVELPSLDEGSASGAAETPAPRPLATTPYELVGRRAQLKGLVAKAVLNGRKGLVLDYYEDRGRLAVRIDGMQPDVAVKMDNLAELPEDDFYVPNEEPPEAPPAGLYFCGDRVYVERSDGSTSEATIVEYDEVFETYTVNLGGAVCKYGVEESYIQPIVSMDKTAGDFHVGRKARCASPLTSPAALPSHASTLFPWRLSHPRRAKLAQVRVPHLGVVSDLEDDKNGVVRGFDEATQCYTLLMDSGVVVRDIKRDEIKVTYQVRA